MLKSVVAASAAMAMAAGFAASALAQGGGAPAAPAATATPAAPAAGRGGGGNNAPLQVPNPIFTTVTAQIDVNRPIDQVWGRVGGYCQVEWIRLPCTITSGDGVSLGSVRSIVNEIMVGKTQYSYTYNQPVREGQLYNQYHGTLEARSTGPNTTRLFYSLVWDVSLLPEANRAANITQRQNSINTWLANMKILAEGGTLPPAPARGGAAAPAPAAAPAAGRGPQ